MLQDGASAIYGSDAIAGVVNIITKRVRRASTASAQLGEYLDAGRRLHPELPAAAGATAATARPRSSSAASYVKQGGVFAGDRAISAFPAPYSTTCADWRLLELPAQWPVRLRVCTT